MRDDESCTVDVEIVTIMQEERMIAKFVSVFVIDKNQGQQGSMTDDSFYTTNPRMRHTGGC
jgi:hypothetical protein